jgi:hypothetical protein
LASLPFLIWEFSSGRIQEVVVVGCGGFLVVEGIVGRSPKEISGRDFRKIF